MVFLSWSIANFVGIVAIAATLICMMLSLIFSSSTASTVKKISLLLCYTLILFLALSVFYWLSPYLYHENSGNFLTFQQENIAFFVVTLFAVHVLILYAVDCLHDHISFALTTVLAIVAGCIWLFIFPLEKTLIFQFFSVVILISLFIDVLVTSQTVRKGDKGDISTSHTFFVVLNCVVMIFVSAAMLYDISPLYQSALLICSVLIAYGMLPFTSSFWRYLSFSALAGSSIFFLCAQTLLIVHIVQQISFEAFDNIFLVFLLCLAAFMTFRPNAKRQVHRPIKAIFACYLTAVFALSSFFPGASLHAQISLVLSLLLFMLLFHAKSLPRNESIFAIYYSLLVFASMSYLVIFFAHQKSFSLANLNFTSLQEGMTFMTTPLIFMGCTTLLSLYNMYQILFFIRKKRSLATVRSSFKGTTKPYLVASSLCSLMLVHLVFILNPYQ